LLFNNLEHLLRQYYSNWSSKEIIDAGLGEFKRKILHSFQNNYQCQLRKSPELYFTSIGVRCKLSSAAQELFHAIKKQLEVKILDQGLNQHMCSKRILQVNLPDY